MTANQVIIYSNGIADFQRQYEVQKDSPQRISIPVRQDHLADVLASFNVYGKVALDTPPTFRPSNELEGNLTINPQQVLEDFATNLSGARVRIERSGGTIEGTLVGLHQESEATAGEPIHPKSVIVLTAEGLRRCVLREIQSFQFLDEDVRSEIDKALQRNYQRIKPNSTFVELVLSTREKSSDAIVQYTIPAAAWKISYRLRIADGQPTEFQGFAIVDNNTDEDWNDFQVCVVTGEPITFSTDLAQSKTPSRKHVNLVSDTALGAVEVEEGIVMAAMGGVTDYDEEYAMEESMPRMRKLQGMRGSRSVAARSADYDAADMGTAEVHEVGDFSVFESDGPVTIPAKRSTVIPVFQVEVAEAKSVLHYKHENHEERPYRSVDFTNRTEFSLGRGVCTVYEQAAYAGNCVVPALKQGESRLLPHALETGVKVNRDMKRLRSKIVALCLADGFCYTSIRQRREIHYHIKNSREETYEFVLDHTLTMKEPDLEAQLATTGTKEELEVSRRLKDGVRYAISIAPHSEQTVKVVEQRIDKSQVELVKTKKNDETIQTDWLEQNIVQTNGPLASHEGILQCLEIQHDLEAKQQDIAEAVKETKRLADRQTRLRENIKTGGQDEITSRWRSELDEAEQSIREIEEQQLPKLRAEEKSIRAQLKQQLKSLAAEWSDEAG